MDLMHDTKILIGELAEKAKLEAGDLLVIGCSTSEIRGERIGQAGSEAIGETLFKAAREVLQPLSIDIAVQCCEHLNRALVVEKDVMRRHGFERVNAVPQPHAGGSFATAAWAAMTDPVLVRAIKADAGIDIGDTLIGMHLKSVAVPVRLSASGLGSAHVTAARVRCPFVGGVRAVYQDDLL